MSPNEDMRWQRLLELASRSARIRQACFWRLVFLISMTPSGIFEAAFLLSTLCGLCFHVARTYPRAYLRCEDAIVWATHAIWLGLIFGMGVIVGRYGFLNDATGAIAHWLVGYVPIVVALYVGALLYHRLLCMLAKQREGRAFMHLRSRTPDAR